MVRIEWGLAADFGTFGGGMAVVGRCCQTTDFGTAWLAGMVWQWLLV